MCSVQGGNLIGDDGAKSIAAAVEGNSSLRILGLVRRSFGGLLLMKLRFSFASWCVRVDACCAARQPDRRRRRKIDCSSLERKQQLAVARPCEMHFGIFAHADLALLLLILVREG